MPQMVQNAEKKYDVELSQVLVRQLVKIENTVVDLRFQFAVDLQEAGELNAIDRHGLGAVALRLKTEPSVPGTDVQHTLAAQIAWNRIARVAFLLHSQRHVSIDEGTVREFEAVIP